MSVSTAHLGLPVGLAVLTGILTGAALGLINGLLVSYAGVPSLILTIAMGTVFTGLSLQLAGSNTIYEGIPTSYRTIAGDSFAGVSNQVWIAILFVMLGYLFLNHTVWGRYLYAIGGNSAAAALSGIRVNKLTTLAFVLVGVASAISALMLTSQVGANQPSTGVGLLLPAYAAAFLGASMFGRGTVSVLGSMLGAVYLQMIGTGLTLLNLPNPVVQITQGGILVIAIVLSRMERNR